MNKENKLVPGLPSGFEDRWDKKTSSQKKAIKSD
jgi:histidyl-tRNA synthetase